MRKTLLSVLLMVMMTVAAFADKEDLYVLHADFEDGKALPEGWTSESVFGAQDWIVEQGGSLDYPAGAAVGNGRVALRNTTEQTQGFITRLITPAMDLTVLNVQPMLIFSHAQAQRLGDVDVLKVFYRTSPEARWIQLAEFDEKITKWQVDTIYLDAYSSKTYQIAFEGTDRFGRGIVLDEIIVRPDIVCEDARDIHARSLSGDEAIIEWGGSLDTDSFEVVVSKKLYENMDDVDWSDTAIIRHEFVYDFIDTLQNLDINTSYYIYIKAYCPSLEGQWVGGLIKTLNKVKVPFVEHFDAPFNKDNPAQAPNWTYGTSMREDDGVTMRAIPYLTNYRTESMWKNYSPNATPALEFAAAINAKALPAGEYAYAASPEIDIERIQDAYVDFWATPYLYDPEYSDTEHYASGIIVGVMDNPADYSTFVPVDTCYAINKYKFDFFRVKFNKYTGNGKFIAFVADFEEKLLFFIDEVTIGSLKELARPVDIKVKDFTPTTIAVEPTLINATAWNLIVSDVKTEEVDKLKPANILAKYENIPISIKDTLVALTNMEGKWIRVYVQAINGEEKSDWSYAQKYMMPNSLASTALPKTWDFETKPTYSYEEIWDYTSQTPSTSGYLVDGIISHVFHYADGYRNGSTETTAHGGSYSYHLNKRNNFSPYAVFPQLDSLQNKMFTFYYKDAMSSGYSQPYYQIGVMTDPQDTATFELVKAYDDAQYGIWKKGEVTFFDYKGNGRYIAIRLVDGPNTIAGKLAFGNIDDVTISAFDGCIKPLNVIATAEDSTVTIKWDANGMTKWAVAFSENWEVDSLFIRDTVETNTITIKNLKPHTPYTYQITTLEGSKKSASDVFTIKTECAAYELVPYFESFEYPEKSYSDPNPNGPYCWTIPLHKDISSSSTYYFPYVNTSNAVSGNQKLYFGRHFGTSGSSLDSCYAALPLFNKELKELQLSFYIRGISGYVNDTLYVGIMSDPNDIKTFDTVYTFTVTGMDYKEHIVNFSNYAGQGKYIAFYKPVTLHYYFIDDVEVKELPACEKVFDVKIKGIHDRGAIFSWYKKDAAKWQFVVSTKKDLSEKQLAEHDESIVMDSLIEVNPFTLDDDAIEANKQYYAYVRAVCGGDIYGDWSSPVSFKTVCTARGIDDFGGTSKVEDFSQSSTSDCWKFGHRVSGGTHNIISGHIQLINSAAQDGSYAIARKLSLDSLQYLQITFEAWNNGSASSYAMSEVTVGIITNPEDLSTFVPLQVVEGQREQDAEVHQSYTVRFNDYVGDYNDDYGQFVMFISESGENSNKIELDNIYFDSISAYLEPLDIWADSIGADAMKIRWENTKADSYEYIISDKLNTLDGATPVAVAADSTLLTELGMLKTYYVRVRAKYGENYSRWSNWRKFTTECPASRPIPWAENFDTGSSSTSYKNTPQCWGAFGSDGTIGSDCITPTVYNSAKKDGVGGLYIGGSKTVASYTILPRFDADLSKAILAFEYKLHTYSSSYEDSLWIGVAKDVENLESLLNSVVWIDQLVEKRTTSAANVWTKYQKKLEGAGNGQYIVLKAKSTYTTYSTTTKYGFYIDNMSVEPEASCQKPEAPIAVARELNGLGFSWTDTIASAWDVIAVGKGDDAPAMDATPAATVDTTYALISGLEPQTEYDLYVRANCGGGDVSYWVGPVTMKTLSAASYPFFTDFEAEPTELTPGNSASYKIHEGWVSVLGKGTTASYYPYVKQDPTAATATYAYSYGHDESHSRALYFQANGTNDSALIVVPALFDPIANKEIDLDTVQVRFQARKISSGIGTKDKQIPHLQATGVSTTGDPSTRNQKVTNQRAILVGTVTNPMDVRSFQALDSFVLAPFLSVKDTVLTTEDPRENDWWEEISVPLAGAKGKYIAIMYSASSSQDFYIDNLYVEKAVGLYAPNDVKGVASSNNSITITWTNRFNAPKIDVGYVAAGGKLSDLTVVTTEKDTLEITGLESNKQYDFYVRANDGAGKTSKWSAGNILATRYVVDLADASWDFNRTNNYMSQTTGNLLPLGWIVGSKYATSTSYIPKLQFNAVNTTTLAVTTAYGRQKVARNGALYIQSFVSASNNSDGAYAIMPLINGDLENKELHFWARVCAMTISNGAATSATSATYATAAYPRAIKVGYVTDPDSIQTFVELADIQLPALSSSSAKASEDPSGNEFWNEISVPLKGIGEGKYIAFLSEYGNTNNVWIDQIDFRDAGSVCYTPNRLTVDSVGAHAAKFSWQLGEGEWAILLSTTKNEAQVIRDTVNARAYVNDTLLSNTSYVFKVKKICSESQASDEVSVEFTTNCDPYDKEKATWSFSDKLVDQKAGTSTIKIPECWISGLGNGTSYTYFPQAAPNTTSIILAKEETRTTSDRALQFYTTTSNYNAYAVLPPLDVNRDSTILHFFGRAARFNKTFSTTNKTFLNAINNGYLRKLVVGTMSDPDNLETFVPVDTISYDHIWSVLKESNLTQDSLDANNYYWQEYILDLKNYKGGEYIAFLAPKPEATSYFYIDELAIMNAETCTEISAITVSDITKTSATLNWSIPKGVEQFYLEVSTDKEFEDSTKFILRDTINSLSYSITNLEPATEYYVQVKHICSEQQQSEFASKSFTTLYAIRFTEMFEEERTVPANWALYNYANMRPTNTDSWEHESSDGDDVMYGSYMSSQIMGSWKRWLETPQIDLTDVVAADSIALSFDLASTNKNLAQEDSLFFLVMVSTDGGQTYPTENRIIWGTTNDCNYPFSAISTEKKGTRWYIDLSKYNGQVIRIMFGTDVTKLQGSTGYIYLDNVQLNYYTKEEYAVSICEWTEFEDVNFTIDANDLKVNATTDYEKFTQSVKEGEKDKLARLALTVTGCAETTFEASICEGAAYEGNGFVIEEVKSGTYRRKLQGSNSCDSVATLNLTVLPKQYEIVEKTICQGNYYEFNGVKYYTSTIHSDTLPAANGCDSIVTLYLTVNPILVGETEEVFLCPDSVYYFSEKYPALTEAGIYKDTIQNAQGCDSVISVDIKNVPNEYTLIRAAICDGEVYNKGVFGGLTKPGDYPSMQKTVYGCDSIVTLHLLVATATEEQTFVLNDSVSPENLPYVLNDEEILPVGTEEGVYTRTINLNCGEATLVITVGNPQSINNTFVNSLAVMPNPAQVGEPIRILGTFDDASIEVTSATGALVYTAQNLINPITIPGMPVAGVYLIRLRENGRIYQAKLMVK